MAEVRAGYARGWSYIPLRGKRPYFEGWEARPRETLETALLWARRGNVGIRTGLVSGLVVIDVDLAKGATVPAEVEAVPTWTAKTGGDGRHFYFGLPDEVDV